MAARRGKTKEETAPPKSAMPGQVVLVLQGGGALGAYQVGVYQALHEAGIEPDWVIGTSIGAINGALIAGNRPADRLACLDAFWRNLERLAGAPAWLGGGEFGAALNQAERLLLGVPGFFALNPFSAWSMYLPVGVERAAFYDTGPLRTTLAGLLDPAQLNAGRPRLTVGAVNVKSGAMHYFDSHREPLDLSHVMASGALPPAFPAVRVGGEPFWDGGVYSNTPLEAVFDDRPRRDSVVFTVNMWHAHGPEPASIWDTVSRQKDIQYASRADSHLFRQKQLHRLRHIVNELGQRLPAAQKALPEVREMLGYGCTTQMHVVRLLAPRLAGEDATKDIDFSAAGIRARRAAGYADARRVVAQAPWTQALDTLEGVAIHEPGESTG